ncbi:MAG: right-handed parallel beta-helix repeat-containing protein [Bacteroidales bacterium]|jgi:pectate lyase|nr:right-handed parallel beta-helix repeat-containing protein [Bacteroidales bacterium]
MKNRYYFFVCLLLVWTAASTVAGAQKTLRITDFGASPDSWTDVVPAVKQVIDACKEGEPVVIDFPKGRYDFWFASCNSGTEKTIGLHLKKMKNVTIEGNGSEFIFHGNIQIALLDSCEDIVLRNFSVDWDRPFISQAEIVHAADNYLDVKIDKKQYPYFIEKEQIMFTGEGWKQPVAEDAYNNLYDKDRKEIVPQTWDGALGGIFRQKAEDLGNGIVRFWGEPDMKPEKGTFVALNHARTYTIGIQVRRSKNTLLKNITVYHALSHGILGEMSENITIDNTSMTVNEAKGRVFSIVADASHFINCKGVIKVENCAHTGQGDDFINVHGRNVMIQNITDAKTIEVKTDGYCTAPGDELWFLNYETAQRGEVRIVESVIPLYKDKQPTGYRITFTSALPAGTKVKDFVENKTWSASLELRNCKILKKHRARGILVTTPKDVVIENNYFRTAGTAILIEGDLDFWFESGANTNVKIRNNVFEDCLTSGNKTGNRWEWGDAVITVSPSHHPTSETTEPYHKNISIRDNVFKVFDAPLVRARSVRGLQFVRNEVIKTNTYPTYTWQKSAFLLDGCREVVIRENKIDSQYTTRPILIENMKKSDVKVDKAQGFNVDFVKGIKTYLN